MPESNLPVTWDWEQINTAGELMDVVHAIHNAGDQEAADRFMEEYEADNEHARANVGYMAGYSDSATMQSIHRMFKCEHPVLTTYGDTQ